MSLDVGKLQESFSLVAPRAEQFAEQLYARLFRDCPDIAAMFAGTEPHDQQRRLLSSMTFIIENLRDGEKLVDYLTRLGARHRSYGVEPCHYQAVGTVLLTTLVEFGGDAWTPIHTVAWKNALGVIRDIMLTGAGQSVAA